MKRTVLEKVRLGNPFLPRSVTPPLREAEGKAVLELRRMGKRIAMGFEGEVWLVLHLMIAGRLHWRKKGAPIRGKNTLAAFDFEAGSLVLTEAGSQRRASLYTALGEEGLRALERSGLEVMEASKAEFAATPRRENHTVKRSLTDPDLFSGIGNAYSHEILHRARLSPVALTQRLSGEEIRRLYEAVRWTLAHWVERLRAEAGDDFLEGVTAFREGMAVHGRYGQPCPVCGAKIQRIRYASNETNYCAKCQTGGRLLADRALSRLLKQDWPRMLDEG